MKKTLTSFFSVATILLTATNANACYWRVPKSPERNDLFIAIPGTSGTITNINKDNNNFYAITKDDAFESNNQQPFTKLNRSALQSNYVISDSVVTNANNNSDFIISAENRELGEGSIYRQQDDKFVAINVTYSGQTIAYWKPVTGLQYNKNDNYLFIANEQTVGHTKVEKINLTTKNPVIEDITEINEIYRDFIIDDDENIYVATDKGNIYKNSDPTPLITITNSAIIRLTCHNNKIYAVANNGNNSTFFSTNNTKSNFEQLGTNDISWAINSITIDSNNELYAGGQNDNIYAGDVNDNLNNFKIISQQAFSAITAVVAINNTLLVGSDNGFFMRKDNK